MWLCCDPRPPSWHLDLWTAPALSAASWIYSTVSYLIALTVLPGYCTDLRTAELQDDLLQNSCCLLHNSMASPHQHQVFPSSLWMKDMHLSLSFLCLYGLGLWKDNELISGWTSCSALWNIQLYGSGNHTWFFCLTISCDHIRVTLETVQLCLGASVQIQHLFIGSLTILKRILLGSHLVRSNNGVVRANNNGWPLL
jgi:hypothetical protein